jgi:hypothetical protein
MPLPPADGAQHVSRYRGRMRIRVLGAIENANFVLRHIAPRLFIRLGAPGERGHGLAGKGCVRPLDTWWLRARVTV